MALFRTWYLSVNSLCVLFPFGSEEAVHLLAPVLALKLELEVCAAPVLKGNPAISWQDKSITTATGGRM